MLERIHIKNFRGLRDLEMDDLARINLIGGRNNSGKTSLLEAVLLLSAAEEPAAVINAGLVRGIDAWARESDGVQWPELFNELDDRSDIQIDASDGSLGSLVLNIAVESRHSTPSATRWHLADSPLPSGLRPTILLRYGVSGEDAPVSMPYAPQQDVKIVRPNDHPGFDATILLPRTSADHAGLANRLVDLVKAKREHVVLDALQVVDPRLKKIVPISIRDAPMIWCDIGLPALVALPAIGEGMINLTKIVMAIAYSSGGAVLVDEIENGFHHSVIPDVWKVIAKAAKDADTQVFATTHSYECFEAAVESLDAEDFRYHRLDVVDGDVRAVTYEHEVAAAAVKHSFEVR